MEAKAKVKEWGNSLAVIIPKEIVRKEEIKPNEEVLIDIRKKKNLMELFGSLKSKKSTQKIMDEIDRELDIDI